MAYDVTKLATLGQLGNLAERTVAAIAPTLKSLAVSGNRVNFYTSTDATGDVAFYFDFAEEIFLDQTGTTLVQNFAWSAVTYPNSTNPNLEGKTVLVLAVKGDKQTNPTVKYSFVNLETLVDTYTASDTSLTISGYNIKVNIDPSTDTMLTLTANGLLVDGSGKVNKVSSPTAGNIPLIASDGGITNSTIAGSAVAIKPSTFTLGNVMAFASDGGISDSTIASADILTKITGATAGNVVTFASDGTLADSTYSIATDAECEELLQSILPTVSAGS